MAFGTAILVRKVLALGLLLILPILLLLAACGGGDGEGGSGSGSNATATSAEETDGAEPTGEDGESSPTGASSGVNGGSGEIDACALLTDAEVEAVLGTPASGSPEADLGAIQGCRWEPGGLLLVTVSVFRGSKEEVEAYFEFSQANSDSVEGIGQKAHYNDITKSLEVLVDDETDVTVAVVNADIDEKQAAIDLAEMVINRLP